MNSPRIRRILRILPIDFLIFDITVVGFFIIERLLNLLLFSDSATLKPANTLGYEIAMLVFQIVTYLGWINTVFLFLLCLTINKTFLLSLRFCVIESILYCTISSALRQLILLIPANIRYHCFDILTDTGEIISKNAYGIRMWFSDGALLLYTYIILFAIFIIGFRYINNRPLKKKTRQ